MSDELREQIEEEMVTLNRAWEVLGDPHLRAEYNRELGIHERVDGLSSEWVEPPLPTGFDYFPRPVFLSGRARPTGYSKMGDTIHQALSLVPLQNELSSLRSLWPDGVWRLEASGVKITDDQLAHVAGMTGLQELNLFETWITDKGLEHLVGLTNLNELVLGETAITDAGLAHIGRITSIEALTLSDTAITDEGLAYLSTLEKLDYLDLRGSRVRGPGLKYLMPITDLDVLSLPYGIKRKFRKDLLRALPHLELRR